MQNYQIIGFQKRWLLLALLSLCFAFQMIHPLYLGVTELKYNQQSQKMEVSVKLFTDDFEKTLHQIHKIPIDLIHPKDPDAADQLVSDYIANHLFIRCDNRDLHFKFIGYEREEEAIWSYFETEVISSPKSVTINNSLFYQYIEEQMHIMQVNVGGEKKSYKLTNPDTKVEFQF
jgi:hypothetical protein